MNRETLDRYCERGILALVLAILVFGPLATAAVRTQEFVVLMALTAGVLVLWGVRLWAQEKPKLLFPPICWAVLAFTIYAIWRYATCDIEYIGRLELLRMLVYAFLFFAILNNLHGQEMVRVIAFTVIFLAMVLAMLAVWQWFTRTDKVPSLGAFLEWWLLPAKTWYFTRLYGVRASATYISPNHLAGMLELVLPLAVTCTLVGRSRPVTKVLLGYAALVIVVGLGTTVSRGSWVACGLTTMVLFGILAMFRSYRLPALTLMLVVAGGSAFFVTRTDYFKERFRRTFTDGHVAWDTRELLWNSTKAMWQDNFWVGVGPGHYNYRFRPYRPMAVQLQPDHAHNEYLNLVADWGVVGAAIVGTGLVVFFMGVARTWRFVRRDEYEFKSNYSNKFALVLGGTLGLVALLGHSFVDFNLQLPANAILAVTLVALVSSHLRFASEKYWVSASGAARIIVALLLLAGTVVFAQQTVRLGREYLWLERAAIKPIYSDEQIACLQKAWTAEPRNYQTTFAIGEAYRTQSMVDGNDYTFGPLATNAMIWFARGTNANPHDSDTYLKFGVCLDWVRRYDDARPFFDRAYELDPNGYFASAWMAWHYLQVEDYAAVRVWAERSLRLHWIDNDIATKYLYLAHRELLRVVPVTNSASGPPR
ncbi:MAG: hypothetical protein EXS35_06830 [Pedosphaera sp.]|nr:hypothetical protein [Pedosphaera sp.]